MIKFTGTSGKRTYLPKVLQVFPNEQEDVVIDSYPFRRWLIKGSTDLPSYKILKEYLVANYKVCYHCGTPVKNYAQIDGEIQADDSATIDHLHPRPYRKHNELVLKVLSCYRCNHNRNQVEQRKREG